MGCGPSSTKALSTRVPEESRSAPNTQSIKAHKFSILLSSEYSNITLLSNARDTSSSTILKGLNLSSNLTECLTAIEYSTIQSEGMTMKEVEGEVKNLGELRHPNVLRMGRCFRKTTETEDYVFITMQEYDLTLDKLILKGELKPSERLEYFKQIVDGVIYIHGKGITHGCLNPSNICIKEGHLMIGNFYKKQNYGSNTPANSSHMYLYLYSPPEKITGGEPTLLWDSWSLGCIFYELSTRHLPFQGNTDFEIFENIKNIAYATLDSLSQYELTILRMTLVKDIHRKSVRDIKQFMSRPEEVYIYIYIYL